MPHVLSPLGRQLRSVVANLGSPQCQFGATICASSTALIHHLTYNSHEHLADCSLRSGYHTSARNGGAATAAAAAAAEDVDAMYHAIYEPEELFAQEVPQKSSRILKRRTRRDYLTEALEATDGHAVKPKLSPWKRDSSHANAKSPDFKEAFRANTRRHAMDRIGAPNLRHTKDLSLERITASLILYNGAVADTGGAVWAVPRHLTQRETSYLRAQGHTMEDIQAWASMISTHDSFVAAKALVDRNARPEMQPVPLFVLQYLLRRLHVNAHALRFLLQQASELLDRRFADRKGTATPENAAFNLFVRLLRHAREVWPEAIVAITNMLLKYLPKTYSARKTSAPSAVDSLTYMLNKAMHLLAIPTAEQPLKDNAHQEAAIVRVLHFMTEHQPSLQLNREGYRAVIQVQLAQRKAPGEQQWAELKSLSWPPWKQERTAMDALITADEHGLTRAGDTLRRMREAGYAPTEWERAAELYTGWDTDRTPTIQTRMLMGTGSARFKFGPAIWAARIATTRTAQEAWAAYLAFEDAKLPPSQDVYLAIFQKLYEEERRQRRNNDNDLKPGIRHNTDRRNRILPGDAREVEPLPPSTHLYTYTRTPVPTVWGFFRQLHDRGIGVSGHCLSFIVANAPTLQLGFRYLRSGQSRDAAISALLTVHPSADHASVPVHLFMAFVELLCRFSNVPLDKLISQRWYVGRMTAQTTPLLDKHPLNLQHPLVYALELLKLQKTTFRPAWNVVLRALCRDATLTSMRSLRNNNQPFEIANWPGIERGESAMLAYRLVRRVLSMMQEIHVDLDTMGFYYLCLATENLAYSCWKLLREDVSHGELGQVKPLDLGLVVHDANALLRSTNHVTRLKGLFQVLVGSQDHVAVTNPSSSAVPDHGIGLALPRLLATPGPALLHAYIRALGWLGDHDGLVILVEWMVEHRAELAAKRAQDRNGEVMMRRAVVALRVFLERSWLPQFAQPQEPHTDNEDGTLDADAVDDTRPQPKQSPHDLRLRNLRRLESGASTDMIEKVEHLVNSVEDWSGWPSDEEVERYCRDSRFEQIRNMYTV